MDMQTLRDECERVYLPSRNFADRTRLSYAGDVRDLLVFLARHGPAEPGAITLAHLNAYLAELDGRGLAGATRNRKAHALKSFFRFLEAHGHVAHNVALRLIPPGTERHEPRVLSEAEYKALKLAVGHHTRDAAIVEVFLQTGLRVSELARLQLADVRLPQKITRDPQNAGEVLVRRGKGRKDRRIALNYPACLAIRAYLKVRPPVAAPALFLSRYHRGMSTRAYQQLLQKYFAEAGIAAASPHALRHTFGTHMVKNGAKLRSVQEMMGHADLKTTSRYIALADKELGKDMQAHAL